MRRSFRFTFHEAALAPVVGIAVVVLLAFLGLTTAQAASKRQTVSVALEGDPIPATKDGRTFKNFDEPMVNKSRDVAFGAELNPSGSGIFLEHGGTTSTIAVTGQTISGVGTLTDTDGLFGDFDGPIFNNNSTVALVVRNATGESASAAVLEQKLSGSLTVVVKQGDAVPGVSGGQFVNFDDLALNNNDDLAFIAQYSDGSTKTGLFYKPNGGAIQEILLNGDVLPDTGGSGVFTGTGSGAIDGPWLNDDGVLMFAPDSIDGQSETNKAGSIFLKRPGQPIESFVLKGEPAPGKIVGTLTDVGAGRPALGKKVAGLKGELTNDDPTPAFLFTKSLSGKGKGKVCTKTGAKAPATQGTFSDLNAPAINSKGVLVFEADVSDDPDIKSGIFTCKRGKSKAIALHTDPKPGGGAFSNDIQDSSISDKGAVVFYDNTSPTGVFLTGH